MALCPPWPPMATPLRVSLLVREQKVSFLLCVWFYPSVVLSWFPIKTMWLFLLALAYFLLYILSCIVLTFIPKFVLVWIFVPTSNCILWYLALLFLLFFFFFFFCFVLFCFVLFCFLFVCLVFFFLNHLILLVLARIITTPFVLLNKYLLNIFSAKV